MHCTGIHGVQSCRTYTMSDLQGSALFVCHFGATTSDLSLISDLCIYQVGPTEPHLYYLGQVTILFKNKKSYTFY